MTRARDLAAFVSNADGDIKFDTDTLFIDSSANKVGIGLTDPTGSLHISNSAPSFYMTDTTNNTEGVVSMDNAGSLILNADLNNEASSSNIRFAVDGTEHVRIDSDGNVGIAGSPTSVGTGHATLNLKGNDSSQTDRSGAIRFERQDGTQAMYIAHSDGDNRIAGLSTYPMTFRTNNTERLRILDGGGITFNGDTAAANALSDYETGTCTLTSPSSVANATGVAHAYANFVKIGNLVTIQGAFDSVNHNSGRIAFTAHVPFAMATTSSTGQLGVCSVYPNSTDESSGYVLNNTGANNTQIYFEMQSDASNSSGTVSYNLSYRAA